MPDDEKFGENPFRGLDPAIFAKKEEIPEEIVSAEDRRLFLRAMDRLANPDPVAKSGFLLSEQCALPEIAVKKKKAKAVEKPAPKPEPIEEDPFLLAMRNTTPLKRKGRAIAPKPVLRDAHPLAEMSLEDFMAGKLEFAISSSNEYLEGHVAGMDELAMNLLREGQISPEANLDLHGLNSAQAFEALKAFIHSAWQKDLRAVLIVTGRGRNSPDGQAILRQNLQRWLTKEPFKRVVLAFCTAKPHDGGPGSIYVLLRRTRKKGQILWERQYIADDL